MGQIYQRMVRGGMGLWLVLALLGISLGQGRAQVPVEPLPRLLPVQSLTDIPSFLPGVVLVRLAGTDARTGHAAQRLGVDEAALTPLAIPGQAGLYRLAVADGDESASAARLMARPDVLYAEPDFFFSATDTTPNDSLYDRYQWNLRHIRANTGWDRTTGSSSVVIAIVDTGVDLGHPDLAGKLVGGVDTINNDSDPQDDQGHGTHVASIAAALGNNSAGIAGVDWNARIMPIKVLDATGGGYSASVATGIVWAADHGADIVNLSLSGTSASTVILNAVQYAYNKGVLVIAAAGNAYTEGNPTSYPAAYPNVLAVAAINDSDGHASYSNSGFYVDVAAPGGDPSGSNDNDSRHWIAGAYWRGSGYAYAQLSGTSQAAPHVAGLAGLLLALNPALTPDQLTQIITSSAVDVQAAGWDQFSGYGRIDVAATLAAVLPATTATPGHTPTASPTSGPTATPTPTSTPSATPTPVPPARSRDDVRVNSTSANAQSDPAVAIDSAGNLTALWRDRRSGTDALYSASLPTRGLNWGANLRLTGTEQISATDSIGVPSLAVGADGSAVAVWHDDQAGNRESDIFVSRLDLGTSIWGEPAQMNRDAIPPATQVNPVLAVDGSGALVAVWEDGRATTEAGMQLYWSQAASSRSAWSEEQPLAPSLLPQTKPRLTIGGNTVFAVWVEQTTNESHILTSRRSLSSTGWMTPTYVVSAIGSGVVTAPDIVADAAGNLLAVWQEERSGETRLSTARWTEATGWDIYAPVNDANLSGQSAPRLATNGREVALVWQDDRNGDGDIYVSWAAWPGGDWLPEQRVNQDTAGAQQSTSDVAIDAWGSTTVVWSDSRGGPSAPDIYARFMPAGERYQTFLPGVAKP